MKIIALHTDFRIYWQARLKALSATLQSRGDSLDVIEIAGKGSPYAFADYSSECDLNWHILFPDSKPEELSGKEIEPVLFHLLDEIQPDVIIAGAIAFPSGALAVKYGISNGTRVICFDDAKKSSVKRSKVVDYIKKAVYSGVDAMLYPAEQWDETGFYWKFTKEKLFYGLDVVDNDFWHTPKSFNNPWGNYFVSVGRQIPKKHHEDIVNAYIKYHQESGKEAYKLVLIGEGHEHAKIKKLADESECKDNIIFLPYMSQSELPAIYQNAKAMIIGSDIQETWGLVINEALAAGCPVFASNQCGASNVLIKTSVNGYKFDCHDVDALAKIMLKYHNLTDQERLEMRNNCIEIISNWGLDKFSSSLLQAIVYVKSHNKRTSTLVSKFIINKWKGQYRPI